jgi:hypothetical protein
MKFAYLLATVFAVMAIIGCGGSTASGEGGNGGNGPTRPQGSISGVLSTGTPTVPASARLVPTPTPLPAATSPVTGSLPTPVPTAVHRPAVTPGLEGNNGQGDGHESQAGNNATATPEPAPPGTPTPTPRFQPVQPPAPVDLPAHAGGEPIFKFSSGPRIQNNVLTLSGYITNRRDLAESRWTVQVWQAEYPVDDLDCSTEKPIAFVMAPTGGTGTIPARTEYAYFYCIQGQGVHRTVNVPWLRASTWTLQERGGRRFIHDPFHWDFNLRIDLNDSRVEDLEYRRPEGWTILIFAGDVLIAREWVAW